MNEMVDLVAEAIQKAGGDLDQDGKMSAADVWENCYDMARAAIQAMREPTPGMLSVGRDEWNACDPEDSPLQNAHDVYQAMIDEALK